MDDDLLNLIRKHEGFRASAYRDTRGYLTMGYGRLIDARRGGGITRQEAEFLLAGDTKRAEATVRVYHGADGFTAARYNALVSMAFNLGRGGMRRFTNMSAAIACNDWELAADEALNSVWARQVPARAREIARALRGS